MISLVFIVITSSDEAEADQSSLSPIASIMATAQVTAAERIAVISLVFIEHSSLEMIRDVGGEKMRGIISPLRIVLTGSRYKYRDHDLDCRLDYSEHKLTS